MKNVPLYIPFLLISLLTAGLRGEVIEKIYAVVENEMITQSEYLKRERAAVAQLSTQFEGRELTEKIRELKENLLDQIIDQKLLLAEAKTRDYDVDNDIQVMLDQIKKNYNFKSDDEFKEALSSQGVKYQDYIQFLREQRLTERLVYEEVEPQIKIDASQIMEFYKNHQDDYRIPRRVSLNAVFLNRDYYLTEQALLARKQEILEQLPQKDFLTVANENTDLEGEENPGFLGEFKVTELDENILQVAEELKEGETAGRWIETGSGYYLIQVVKWQQSELQPYKDVRDQIQQSLHQREYDQKFREFVQNLREESYIKIYRDEE